MHKSRPGQVREILSFGQTKERESKKNLFQIFSLFTRISFDQNINFADENWVTFHFMQLDNVFMLFNNCQKRISLGSPSPFYLGSDSHLMTLSKWFSKKKFLLLADAKCIKSILYGFHNRCVWREGAESNTHFIDMQHISTNRSAHKSPSNGRLRFMIWFNEITLRHWMEKIFCVLFFVDGISDAIFCVPCGLCYSRVQLERINFWRAVSSRRTAMHKLLFDGDR